MIKSLRYLFMVLVLGFWFGNTAFAGFSVLTSQVIIGGEKLDRFGSTYETVEGLIQDLALQVGEVCYQTEAFIFERGASLSSVMLLESSFQSTRWDYSELYADQEQIVFMAYGPHSNVLGSWHLLDEAGFLTLCAV